MRLYRQSGSDRLEKQPTDLWRHHHYMRDGTLELYPKVNSWKALRILRGKQKPCSNSWEQGCSSVILLLFYATPTA